MNSTKPLEALFFGIYRFNLFLSYSPYDKSTFSSYRIGASLEDDEEEILEVVNEELLLDTSCFLIPHEHINDKDNKDIINNFLFIDVTSFF